MNEKYFRVNPNNVYSSVVRMGNDYYQSLPRQRNTGRPQSPPPMDMSKQYHQTMVYIPYNHIEGYSTPLIKPLIALILNFTFLAINQFSTTIIPVPVIMPRGCPAIIKSTKGTLLIPFTRPDCNSITTTSITTRQTMRYLQCLPKPSTECRTPMGNLLLMGLRAVEVNHLYLVGNKLISQIIKTVKLTKMFRTILNR